MFIVAAERTTGEKIEKLFISVWLFDCFFHRTCAHIENTNRFPFCWNILLLFNFHRNLFTGVRCLAIEIEGSFHRLFDFANALLQHMWTWKGEFSMNDVTLMIPKGSIVCVRARCFFPSYFVVSISTKRGARKRNDERLHTHVQFTSSLTLSSWTWYTFKWAHAMTRRLSSAGDALRAVINLIDHFVFAT